MSSILLVPAALALGIILLFMGLARVLTSQGEQIDSRLERYATRDEYAYLTGEENPEEQVRGGFLGRWLERRASNNKEGTITLRDELARADLKLRVSEWQMIQIGAVIVMALLGFIIFRQPILAVVTAVFGFFLPRFYLRWRQGKRLNAFESMLSDTLVMMANSLRAGYSFLQSMEVLSQEMPEPVAGEFKRVVREVGLGLTQQQALMNLLRRIPSEDLDMMITAINVQQEVGGNLAEILDTLAYTIRERNRIQGEIRVLVAQQMLAGYVITFLPVGLAGMLFLLNREYMAQLYQDPCGWMMVGVSIAMIVFGFLAIQKIVNIEV